MLPLQIKDVDKIFESNKVLSDIKLSVGKNEIFGLIALNGQGKTTLIKIMLDLLDPDSGEIKLFGKDHFLPESRQMTCYLPEKFAPSRYLSGFEFINFVLNFYSKKPDQIKIRKLCDELDFNHDYLSQKIGKYSKGMTQKLGLMALLLTEAELVILDEPMSGLDPKARIALKEQLISYKKLGKTIFFTSHILSDMDEICDHIAILSDSKIVYCGSPKDFKAKHKEKDLDKAFLKEIS